MWLWRTHDSAIPPSGRWWMRANRKTLPQRYWNQSVAGTAVRCSWEVWNLKNQEEQLSSNHDEPLEDTYGVLRGCCIGGILKLCSNCLKLMTLMMPLPRKTMQNSSKVFVAQRRGFAESPALDVTTRWIENQSSDSVRKRTTGRLDVTKASRVWLRYPHPRNQETFQKWNFGGETFRISIKIYIYISECRKNGCFCWLPSGKFWTKERWDAEVAYLNDKSLVAHFETSRMPRERRIIPGLGKWLVTPISKPFRTFGRGPTTSLTAVKLLDVCKALLPESFDDFCGEGGGLNPTWSF